MEYTFGGDSEGAVGILLLEWEWCVEYDGVYVWLHEKPG